MSRNKLKSDNAVNMPIVAKRNDTFQGTFTLRENGSLKEFSSEFDSAIMQVKTSSEATSFILELTSADSEISFNDSGVVTLIKADEDMNIDPDVYHYDIQFTTAAGAVETIFEGTFTVTSDVTR